MFKELKDIISIKNKSVMQKSSKQITDLKIMINEKNSLMRLSNKCEQLKIESVNLKTGQLTLSSLRNK